MCIGPLPACLRKAKFLEVEHAPYPRHFPSSDPLAAEGSQRVGT